MLNNKFKFKTKRLETSYTFSLYKTDFKKKLLERDKNIENRYAAILPKYLP